MRIVLNGGGNAAQSRRADEFFAELLPRRSLLFLPQAVSPQTWSYDVSFEWIHRPVAFRSLSITMWRDLAGRAYDDLDAFDALYLMGGTTSKLLHCLRTSGFDKLLTAFVESGRPVYGSCAGAIVLGQDIANTLLTPEPDPNDVGLIDLTGLGVLGGNVYTRYTGDQEGTVREYAEASGQPLLVLAEETSVHIDGDVATVLGFSPALLLRDGRTFTYSATQSFTLR